MISPPEPDTHSASSPESTVACTTLSDRVQRVGALHEPNMPDDEAIAVPEKPVAASRRVEGWTHYYEYFHELDAAMQVRKEARGGTSSWP